MIIFFIPSFTVGGAEKIYISIANSFVKKYHVKILSLNRNGPLINLIDKRIELISFDVKRVRYSVKKIINYVNINKPEIIYSPHRHANNLIGFCSFFFKYKPKIIFREANSYKELYLKYNLYQRIFFKTILKICYRRCSKIIVVTKQIENELVNNKLINKNKIIYIPNPTIPNNFKDLSLEKFDKELMNIENENFFINIGRLHYQKNHLSLINIFYKLKKMNNNIKLLIIGNGNKKKEILEIINKKKLDKDVIIIDYTSNVFKYLKKSKGLLLTSLFEGIGNVIIESLSVNTPVIAYDTLDNNLKQYILSSGGKIIRPFDEEEFAIEAMQILNNSNNPSFTNTNNIIEIFSLKNNVLLYENLLK